MILNTPLLFMKYLLHPLERKIPVHTKKNECKDIKKHELQRISTNFSVLVSTVIINSENLSVFGGSNCKNLFR